MKKICYFFLLISLVLSCGKKASQGESLLSKVYGGEKIEEGHKNTVFIFDSARRANCTGFVIDSMTIGTAAHCLVGSESKNLYIFNSNNIQRWHLATFGPNTFKIYDIYRVSDHYLNHAYEHDFSIENKADALILHNDIGYIKLESPIEIASTEIIPIATKEDYIQIFQQEEIVVTAVGMGLDEDGRFGLKKFLKDVEVKIAQGLFTFGSMGESIFNGDSGGPVYYNFDDGYRVIAINSFGYATADGVPFHGIAIPAINLDFWIKSNEEVLKYKKSTNQVKDITYLNEAIEYYPTNFEALKLLAYSYFRKGNFTTCLDYIVESARTIRLQKKFLQEFYDNLEADTSPMKLFYKKQYNQLLQSIQYLKTQAQGKRMKFPLIYPKTRD